MKSLRRTLRIGFAIIYAALITALIWYSYSNAFRLRSGAARGWLVVLAIWEGRVGGRIDTGPKSRGADASFQFRFDRVPAETVEIELRRVKPLGPRGLDARWLHITPTQLDGFRRVIHLDLPAWLLYLPLAWPLARRVSRWRRTEIRRANGLCIACGYILHGLGTCPECGTAAAQSVSAGKTADGPLQHSDTKQDFVR